MERLESVEDEMRGVVTYEVANGQRVKLDVRAVRDLGAVECLRRAGVDPGEQGERLPVVQRGEVIGTLPANFDPMFARSTSSLHEIRPTDFRREGDRWIACPSLCPGDLDATVGFGWAGRTMARAARAYA